MLLALPLLLCAHAHLRLLRTATTTFELCNGLSWEWEEKEQRCKRTRLLLRCVLLLLRCIKLCCLERVNVNMIMHILK